MNQYGIRIGAALMAVVLGASIAWAQTTPTRSKEKLVSIVGKVEAINAATRELTVKGPQGNSATFTVDKQVTRFNEIAVGDDIVVDYYVSLAAELRAPTAAEKSTPVVVLTETAKAPANTQPAAGALRIIRAVVTVEGLDRPTKSLTVAGPAGNMATTQVDDVAALSKLRLGDTLIVTYTEALAVSLEKRAPKK